MPPLATTTTLYHAQIDGHAEDGSASTPDYWSRRNWRWQTRYGWIEREEG